MKKYLSVLLIIVGFLCTPIFPLFLMNRIFASSSADIGIIGSADGPTAVVVSRSPGFLSVSLIGLVLIVTGIILLCKKRK